MFGNNPVRKQDLRTDGTLDVQEVFYTIQGEGPSAGRPAVFIRLAGCNLRCYFCDTEFESGMGNPLTVNAIIMGARTEIAKVRGTAHRKGDLVVITGGEPLRQNLVPLVVALEANGFEVEIETAGTLWVPGLGDTKARIVCSPKTGKIHPEVLARAAAFKYVVRSGCTDTDGLPILSTQHRGRAADIAKPRDGTPVYVQPMDDGESESNYQNLKYVVSLAMKHGYRVSLQQHKLMGVE